MRQSSSAEQQLERNLKTQIQQREAQRKIELARKKLEISKEFSLQHSRPGSIKLNHRGASKRRATKKQVQPSGKVSTQVGIGQYCSGGISEKAIRNSCLHSGGLTERVSSAASFPTPAKVTIQVPRVSNGRSALPQLVESPSLSAANQPFTPTVWSQLSFATTVGGRESYCLRTTCIRSLPFEPLGSAT